MNLSKIRIDGIPVILWGEPSDKIIIAAHGSHSSKIDDCIWVLAEEATAKGYQVLSFDLPQHGERVYETECIMPDECVRELKVMYSFAVNQHKTVSIFGCSMGAYFELLAFAASCLAIAANCACISLLSCSNCSNSACVFFSCSSS